MMSVDTYSEAWRHECEVRHIASLPRDERRAYLFGVRAKRGKNADVSADRIKAGLWELDRKKKGVQK